MSRRVRLAVERLEDRLALSWAGTPPATVSVPASLKDFRIAWPHPATGTTRILSNEEDYFSFTAPTDGTYRFLATTPNSNLDTVLGVFSGTGQRLTYNDNVSATDTDSAVSADLVAGRRYVFGITNYTGKPGGLYNWTVHAPRPEDRFAGNTTRERAADLGRLTTPTRVPDLVMKTASDWFRFKTAHPGTADAYVAVRFKHAQGNLNLRLYDASGRQLKASEGTTDEEKVSLHGLPAGEYYVQVFGANGAPNYDYTLEVLPHRPEDRFAGNDARERAANLGMLISPTRLTGLVMITGADWFRFQTAGPGTANASVTAKFNHAQGNLNLRLFDASGRQLKASEGTTGEEKVSLSGLPAGDYYVQVFGANGSTSPDYTLEINPEFGWTPADDAYKGNDAKERAADLGTLTEMTRLSDLMLVTPADWFRFKTTGVSTMNSSVTVVYGPEDGNLDLRLYDAQGKVVRSSAGTVGLEQVTLDGLPAGEYFVEVYGSAGNNAIRYGMQINPETRPLLPDDVYKGNDTRAKAANLGALTSARILNDLALVTPSDWFRFQTVKTGTASSAVAIQSKYLEGDIQLRLYDAKGNLLRKSEEMKDAEVVSLEGLPAAEYYVEVTGANGLTNSRYNLVVAHDAKPADDAYKGNVNPQQATDLGKLKLERTVSNLALVTSSDWFRFQTIKTGPAKSAVAIRFKHAEGDLQLRLYDATGKLLKKSEGTKDGEAISLEGLPAAEYYVQITGNHGATNARYDLGLFPGFPPPDDDYKGNDTRAKAANLGTLNSVRTIKELMVITPSDWFRFQTTKKSPTNAYISIKFKHAEGDLQLHLYDAAGNLLRKSEGTKDGEAITLQHLPAGEYYIRVFGANGAHNLNYEMHMNDGSVRY